MPNNAAVDSFNRRAGRVIPWAEPDPSDGDVIASRTLRPTGNALGSLRDACLWRSPEDLIPGVAAALIAAPKHGRLTLPIHDGYSIVVALDRLRDLTVHVGTRTLTARVATAGTSWLTCPDTPCSVHVGADATARERQTLLLLLISPDMVAEENLPAPPECSRTLSADAWLWRVGDHLRSLASHAEAVETRHLLISAAAYACRRYAEPERTIAKGGLSGRQLRTVLDLIESRLESDIYLKALADLVGLSEYHFCRAFKQATGSSPYRFIVEHRLQLAHRLLRQEPGLSVHDIAVRSGYKDPSAFSRQFKQHFGLRPVDIRAGAPRS